MLGIIYRKQASSYEVCYCTCTPPHAHKTSYITHTSYDKNVFQVCVYGTSQWKKFPNLNITKELSKQNAIFNFKLEKMVENSIKMIQYLTFFL